MPKVGEMRWSDYFGTYIILTRYVSDKEWYFKFNGSFREFRAQTLWTEMRESPLDK